MQDDIFEVFAKFYSGDESCDESYDKHLAEIASKKIENIRNSNEEIGKYLGMLFFSSARRQNRLNKFIAEHSEDDLISIVSQIKEKHGDIYKSDECYRELLKPLDCFPDKIEQAIMAMDKIFFSLNPPDMKSIMDMVGGKWKKSEKGKASRKWREKFMSKN